MAIHLDGLHSFEGLDSANSAIIATGRNASALDESCATKRLVGAKQRPIQRRGRWHEIGAEPLLREHRRRAFNRSHRRGVRLAQRTQQAHHDIIRTHTLRGVRRSKRAQTEPHEPLSLAGCPLNVAGHRNLVDHPPNGGVGRPVDDRNREGRGGFSSLCDRLSHCGEL